MGDFKRSRGALRGDSFGWVPSQIDLSDPPTGKVTAPSITPELMFIFPGVGS